MNRLIEALEAKRLEENQTKGLFSVRLQLCKTPDASRNFYSQICRGNRSLPEARITTAAAILGISIQEALAMNTRKVRGPSKLRAVFPTEDFAYLAEVSKAMGFPLTTVFMNQILDIRDAHIEKGRAT